MVVITSVPRCSSERSSMNMRTSCLDTRTVEKIVTHEVGHYTLCTLFTRHANTHVGLDTNRSTSVFLFPRDVTTQLDSPMYP